MIDEVLKDIREAEAKAEQIAQDAYAEGKQIVLQAELDAQKQKKPLCSNVKTTNATLSPPRKNAQISNVRKSSKRSKSGG